MTVVVVVVALFVVVVVVNVGRSGSSDMLVAFFSTNISCGNFF